MSCALVSVLKRSVAEPYAVTRLSGRLGGTKSCGSPWHLALVRADSPNSQIADSSKLDFAVDLDAVDQSLDLFRCQQRIPSDGQVAVDVLQAFEPG